MDVHGVSCLLAGTDRCGCHVLRLIHQYSSLLILILTGLRWRMFLLLDTRRLLFLFFVLVGCYLKREESSTLGVRATSLGRGQCSQMSCAFILWEQVRGARVPYLLDGFGSCLVGWRGRDWTLHELWGSFIESLIARLDVFLPFEKVHWHWHQVFLTDTRTPLR